MAKPDVDYTTPQEMCEWMIDELEYFTEGEDGVFFSNYTNNESPLTIVTGNNASGKSFVRKILQSMCAMRDAGKIECIHLSQQGRCTSGIPRMFIYGSEDDESTGANTIQSITGAFSTSNKRDSEHFLIFDEPEIGLSDEYAGGMGIRIREFIEEKPDLLFGAVVITHSKYLLKELLPLNPNHMNVSDDATLEDIVNREVVPNPDLEGLKDKARDQYMKILDIQKEITK